MDIIIIIKKRSAMQGWERAIYTISVRRESRAKIPTEKERGKTVKV